MQSVLASRKHASFFFFKVAASCRTLRETRRCLIGLGSVIGKASACQSQGSGFDPPTADDPSNAGRVSTARRLCSPGGTSYHVDAARPDFGAREQDLRAGKGIRWPDLSPPRSRRRDAKHLSTNHPKRADCSRDKKNSTKKQ